MTLNWRIGRQRKPSFSYRHESWMDEACCAEVDPELFFPSQGKSPAAAKAVCRECPVQAKCLEYALSSPCTIYGVWGGLTEDERRELRGTVPIRQQFPHGTEAGAQRHRRRGETPCVACREAAAAKARLRAARSSA